MVFISTTVEIVFYPQSIRDIPFDRNLQQQKLFYNLRGPTLFSPVYDLQQQKLFYTLRGFLVRVGNGSTTVEIVYALRGKMIYSDQLYLQQQKLYYSLRRLIRYCAQMSGHDLLLPLMVLGTIANTSALSPVQPDIKTVGFQKLSAAYPCGTVLQSDDIYSFLSSVYGIGSYFARKNVFIR